jgi:DNA-directed RNA polymerase subunit beta'
MRTFHVGGIGITRVEESEIKIRHAGQVRFHNLKVAVNKESKTVSLLRNGEIIIVDHRERELERHILPVGAEIKVGENQQVESNTIIATWDPHVVPILTEVGGRVRYEDIIDEETMRKEVDTHTGITHKVIVEHKGDYHPQIVVEDDKGHPMGIYPMPEKANIELDEGEKVLPGDMIAKTPREFSGAQDITGGLTRATNLFEARRPKDAAVMSEIDGTVEIGERKRGKRTILVRGESGITVEHTVPQGKHILVHTGDRVKAGDRIVDGPLDPYDILKISGLEKTQEYLLQEVQTVYRSQNVNINDKHLEIIVGRMFQKVEIDNPGDTRFLPQEQVDRWIFRKENEAVKEKKGKPATGRPLLLGIARASLLGDSFLAAASFQETTKVLTDAAVSGQVDTLQGLKENVILGHIIPAGTGNKEYYNALTGRKALEALPAAEPPKALTAGE